jgi:hypothetical protein
MSTSEPEVPDTNPPTGERPAAARRGLGGGIVAAIAVAAFVIAGIGGYLIGHSNGEDSGEDSGYAKGVAAGRAQVQKQYQPGEQGYEVIFAKGRHAGAAIGRAKGLRKGEAEGQAQGEKTGEAQGRRVGFEEGQKVGVQTGEAEGVAQGAAAVLAGFAQWTDGSYYIVTTDPGTETGVPYVLATRKQIEPGTNYRLCSGGSLCESPVVTEAANTTSDEDAGGAGDPNASLGSGG